jgi:hypothetical protein
MIGNAGQRNPIACSADVINPTYPFDKIRPDRR